MLDASSGGVSFLLMFTRLNGGFVLGISKKAGATVALAVIAGSPLAPLIADELDATPPAAVAPAAESETAGAVAGGALAPYAAETDGGVVYSSALDARFRIERAQASSGSAYTDIVLVNTSDTVSNHTWVSLDSLRGNLPEGATFGSTSGANSGEIAKGSALVESNIAPAELVEADKDYWYVPNLISGGEARLSVVQDVPTPPAPEPTPEPTPAPTPEKTDEPAPTPSPESPKPSDDATTPAPEKSGDATPAPVEEKKSEAVAPVTAEEVSAKANAVYKAPAPLAVPDDNATRHDAAGRVVSTAQVADIKTDAQTGNTVTTFEDGGAVTTTSSGEVVESTLGSTVTTTGEPVVSAAPKVTVSNASATSPTAKSSTSGVNSVKGQTLRTGAAGVANLPVTGITPAAIPLGLAGGSLVLAGTLMGVSKLKNRKRD